jgi:hypothetical protein
MVYACWMVSFLSCFHAHAQVTYPVEQIIIQDVPFPVIEIVEKLIERTVCLRVLF